MKLFLSGHLVSLYCILNIILTLLIVIIYSVDEVPQQWAPGFIAIFIVYLLQGKANLKKLINKMAFKKAYFKWYVLAFIIPLIVCVISFLIISLMFHQGVKFPTLNHSLGDYLLLLFLIILGSIGEEIGWRGFMLPMLLRKHSYLVSSVLIGIFWGAWHLHIQTVSIFLIYMLLTIEMSIIFNWFYEKTNGNIVSAIITHSSINLCTLLLFEDIVINISQNIESIGILYLSFVGLFLPLCIYIVMEMRKRW